MLYSKALQNPLFHLLKPVVVFVEYLLSLVDITVDLVCLVPWKIQYGLDICARHICIRAHRAHLGEFVDFLAQLGVGLLFKLELVEFFPPLTCLVIGILVFAELLLDDLELLSEVIFSLTAVHVLDHAVVYSFCDRKYVIFLADYIDQVAYSELYRIDFE